MEIDFKNFCPACGSTRIREWQKAAPNMDENYRQKTGCFACSFGCETKTFLSLQELRARERDYLNCLRAIELETGWTAPQRIQIRMGESAAYAMACLAVLEKEKENVIEGLPPKRRDWCATCSEKKP